MKHSFSSKQTVAGFALLATMCFLAVSLLVFASMMYWIMSSSKQTQRNNTYTTSQAAAEAATEKTFAQMDRDYLYQSLNTTTPDAYTKLLPDMTGWPVQYVFSDTNGNPGQISVDIGQTNGVLQPLGSQFANLQGYPQLCTVTATATPQNQLYDVPATVGQVFNFASVPAFQFAIFYNIDLEIDPGEPMKIEGPVFSNKGIWSGTPNVTYSSTVEAVGQVNTTTIDSLDSSNTKKDSGSPASSFLLSGQPISNVNPLVIPIGAGGSTNANNATNVEAIINIPPPGACAPQDIAYASTNLVYDFNAASLIVSNWYNGTNILDGSYTPMGNNFTVYFQDPLTSAKHWIQLTNDFFVITNWTTSGGKIDAPLPPTTNDLSGLPNFPGLPAFPWTTSTFPLTWQDTTGQTNYSVLYAGFSFITNVAFYDYRESSTAQAVQIDVAALRTWITNSAPNGGSNWNYQLCSDIDHGINSIFVYNSVQPTKSTLPAVRLINGQLLPNSTNIIAGVAIGTPGLTIATPQPLYVLGNYNVEIDGDGSAMPAADTHDTSHTYPAAFLADAITVLSTNWSDTNTPTTSLSSRNPANTTINAACLEGIVPSSGVNVNGNDGYSGGVENFLRLLENWNNVTLTYNGSIMVMFTSLYATNAWSNNNYYTVPTRHWGFDTNFVVQSKLPPLTPQFRAVVRQQWNGH